MELIVYTNNDFLYTFINHVFHDDVLIKQIKDCQTFRSMIAKEEQSMVILVDSSEIKDDICWTRMMTETITPIMVINPEEKNTLKKLMLLEQSLSNMINNKLDYENKQNLVSSHKISDNILLNNTTLFDVGNHCIYKNDECYILSTLEFKILYYLAKKLGTPVSVNELIDYLDTTESVLYIYINKIRNKIEITPRNPQILKNIRGQGYIINQYQ
ncbi:winged helix-turn-helix domain-containing protein [Bacillus sp. WLY-B-L8]|uniref:winged helix-turn-helix domain-containing protein n=1 Tax=Bacillus multifaciens TaxID=3068506 RepID=UPI0027425D0C|nr:winged helix-turn-helix domain-containing protein [Bacillus sp. WLY-B-L8]MDP7977692.1 winged helix-turn-helix domain-containing protein [Bacillus sp. WLY-B-L8]